MRVFWGSQKCSNMGMQTGLGKTGSSPPLSLCVSAPPRTGWMLLGEEQVRVVPSPPAYALHEGRRPIARCIVWAMLPFPAMASTDCLPSLALMSLRT